jgi:hypothetical protein
MYFNFDLKGLIPALLVMTVFSIIGIWKLIEVIIWLINHVRVI